MASEIPVLQLAKDVLTETLHGPVPMRTVARLAEGVIAAEARLAAVRKLANLYRARKAKESTYNEALVDAANAVLDILDAKEPTDE